MKGTRTAAPTIFAFDIDGTLCATGRPVSNRTLQALDTLSRSSDVILATVTGRPPRLFPPELREVSVSLKVFFHGALACYGPRATPAIVRPIDPGPLDDLVERLSAQTGGIAFALEGTKGIARSPGFLSHPLDRQDIPGVETDRSAVGEVLKVIVQHWEAAAPWVGLIEELESRFNVVGAASDPIVEVVGRGVDKASTLAAAVSDAYGAAAENVVFVGDGLSDVTALQWAGRGLAPTDAHPAAIEVADTVIGASTADGVAAFVEKWLAQRCR